MSLLSTSTPFWEVGVGESSKGRSYNHMSRQLGLSYYDPKYAIQMFSEICSIEYAEWELAQQSHLELLEAEIY